MLGLHALITIYASGPVGGRTLGLRWPSSGFECLASGSAMTLLCASTGYGWVNMNMNTDMNMDTDIDGFMKL